MTLILPMLIASCHVLHKHAYYSKVDAEHPSRYQDGHHLHEAQRLIDYKNWKRERMERKAEKRQQKIADNLNQANRSAQMRIRKKKRIKFDFYM